MSDEPEIVDVPWKDLNPEEVVASIKRAKDFFRTQALLRTFDGSDNK